MGEVIQFDTTFKKYNDYIHEYIKINKNFILDIIHNSRSIDEMKDSIYILSQKIIGSLIIEDYWKIEDHETLLIQIINELSSGYIAILTIGIRNLVLNTPSIKKVIEEKFGDID